MLRVLIVVLLLTGCATSVPPSPPAAPTGWPSEAPQLPRKERRTPSPTDWFEVTVKDGLTNPAPDGYPKYFGYRSKEPTMHLTFHNVGTEPVTAPTIKLKLEQREPSLSHGDELLTAFTGKATGEDWNCKGSTASITCMSKAEIAPGDSLPTIEVGLRALDTGPRTHFTATLDDLQYEAVLYYDTST